MKSKINIIIFPLLLLVGYVLLKLNMPIYASRYLFFVVVVLFDFYLWSSIKKQVFNYVRWIKVAIVSIYWMPLALIAFLLVSMSVTNIANWDSDIRTYILGIVLVFYTAKILPITFLLLADIVRVTQKLFIIVTKDNRKKLISDSKSEGITRNKFLQYVGFVSGGLVLGTMFIGMFKWVYEFKIFREKIHLPNLTTGFGGIKIVQISDIHLGGWASKKPLQQAVNMINELKPDIIFFTGDLVNYATFEAFDFEGVLSELKASYGIFATLGNHDYGNYTSWPSEKAKEQNMTELYDYYKRLGWNLLNNENEIVNINGNSLAIIGVENWSANLRFPRHGDIDKAMVGTGDADARLLLTHDPSHWEKVIIPGDYNIDIAFSGHTHGFQFGIETKDIKWSPAQYMYKQWAGLYSSSSGDNRFLYVNRGLGSIGYPGRIGILPEITLVEIV